MAKEEKREEKKVKEAPAKVEKPSTKKTGKVNVAILNLRSEPSMNGEVKSVLNFDDEVTIIVTGSKYETEGWFKVKTVKGDIGFVVAQFINGD